MFSGLQPERHAQCLRNGFGYILLDRENIGKAAVVAAAPKVQAIAGLNKLRRDAHLIAVLAHRTFDEVRRTQSPPDGTRILLLAFELAPGGPRPDTYIRDFCDCRDDFLRHGVGE